MLQGGVMPYRPLENSGEAVAVTAARSLRPRVKMPMLAWFAVWWTGAASMTKSQRRARHLATTHGLRFDPLMMAPVVRRPSQPYHRHVPLPNRCLGVGQKNGRENLVVGACDHHYRTLLHLP